MKKFDWKKVLIVIFALILVFSLAACVDDEDDKKPVDEGIKATDFINTLVDGVSGYVTALGSTEGSRHIDTKLVVQVGSDGKPVGETANYEIRIAANFDDTTADYTKNDALIEVKDLNDTDTSKVVLGLYASNGKVYIRESVSTADGSEQQLKIEDITAFEYRQYLAKIPQLTEDLLQGFNLKEGVGTLIDGVGDILNPLFKVTKEGTTYKAELQISKLGDILGMVTKLVNLQPYRDIVNLILPTVLGATLETDNTLSYNKNLPTITLNVEMDENNKFNGLTFDYAYPKVGEDGNDVTVRVGLADIVINNASAPVTEAMDFANYKDGALKVHANVNVPGLTEAGFSFEGDFYLKPGFATIDGTAESENEALKVELVAKKDGQMYPLTAQYKYETDANGKRIGKLYFDIGALVSLANLTGEGINQTKYFVEFDIAEFLIGSATPTQEEFTVGAGLPEGYTATAIFKTYKNRKYYVKNGSFADGLLWAGVEVKNAAGEVVGTAPSWGRVWADSSKDIEGLSYIDVLLTIDGKENVYRIGVTDAQMLQKMKGESVTATATVQTVSAESAQAAVYDANNNLLTDVAKPRAEKHYYDFTVRNLNGTAIDKHYYFYLESAVGSAKDTVLKENINTRLPKILEIITADVQSYATPGYKIELRGIWLNRRSDYSALSLQDMRSQAGADTLDAYSGVIKTNTGLFLWNNAADFQFAADLIMIQVAETGVDPGDKAYAALQADEKAMTEYLNKNLVRMKNGETEAVPAITSDIQINNGTDFEFNINAVGGLVQKLFDKVDGLTQSGTISIALSDAKDILNMGAYLNTDKMFAAQIRMLLSNEKYSTEFNRLAVTAPFTKLARTVTTDTTEFAHASSKDGVGELVKNHNTYLTETVKMYVISQIYGTKTEDTLKSELGLSGVTDETVVGLDGWTLADVNTYLAKETAQAKAEYYFEKMIETYKVRVAKHDAAYAEYRTQMEEKAMKAIRGYVGANGVIPADVNTVEKFLFDQELTITLDFGKDANVITGMPLSVKLSVKRGETLIAELKAGVQLIDASTIPADGIPANYWDNAVDVSTGYTAERPYSDVAVLLLSVHAKFAGFNSWMDVVGYVPPAAV